MSDEIAALKKEIQNLNDRLNKTNREKANLQMAVTMINQVADSVGVSDVVEHIIQILMSVIGGTNIAVYFEAEGRWHYTDILGSKKWLEEIDDALVKQSVAEKRFLRAKEEANSDLRINGFAASYETWVYPLSVQGVFFAAIRIQGLAIEHAHYRENIDPFIQYSSLLLYHEVTNVQKLTSAYQKVNFAKEELQKTNRLLNSVIKNSSQAIIAFNPDKEITLWSQAATDLFKKETNEVMGKSTASVFAGVSPEFEKAFTDILSGKKISDNEISCVREDETPFVAHLSVSPVVNESGVFQGGMAIIADISWRIKIEEHMRRAQKVEAIGTLAGGIAHDFNNILFPILGFSEILKEDVPSDSPLQSSISQIYQASLRAKDLVEQILTFSRRHDKELKSLKLQGVMKETLKLLRASIPKTIDFDIDIDPDCGTIMADPTHIHQVVMNLATNAYHAMRETGGLLKVELKQIQLETEDSAFSQLISGEYARLTIADSGIGIPKDVIEKIFDPYFTTKETNEGTGLGLSVVQGIVKSYSGDIHVYSEPGQGTEIHVYLPLMEETPVKEGVELSSAPVGTESVMLVDDEQSVLHLEKEMIERLGYHVTAMDSSVKALQEFEKNANQYDLVITDMTMPNMTGAQLSSKIKEIKDNMPIIICTGFSDQISKENWNEIGVQGFVMKPILKNEMARAIRSVLDRSPAGMV